MLAVIDEQALVNVGCLLEMAPQILNGSQAQLVFPRVRQRLMVSHHRALIVPLVRCVEQKPRLQRSIRGLLCFLLGLLVLAERIHAARLVDVNGFVAFLLQGLVVGVDRLLVIAIVEVAEGKPREEVWSLLTCLFLELEQRDRTNIVAVVQEVLQIRLRSLGLLTGRDLGLCGRLLLLLGERSAWADHRCRRSADAEPPLPQANPKMRGPSPARLWPVWVPR
mmetsp:Transcript_29898/g.85655  ORF Transcript_29898/g.85655 Transcript_29898/m.85655 type:complete len:222 (+) Transcript_29898:1235-1900(+)